MTAFTAVLTSLQADKMFDVCFGLLFEMTMHTQTRGPILVPDMNASNDSHCAASNRHAVCSARYAFDRPTLRNRPTYRFARRHRRRYTRPSPLLLMEHMRERRQQVTSSCPYESRCKIFGNAEQVRFWPRCALCHQLTVARYRAV